MELNNPTSSRTDRKTIEKNRRNHMKTLYSKLHSLVPHQSSREVVSLPDQLDEAANYIKKLHMNLEKMKEKKNRLMRLEKAPNAGSSTGAMEVMVGLRPPQIEIREMGSALEVVLITGLNGQFIFNEIIRLLHREGAEVVNASFSVANDAVFHSIHSKIEESASGYGVARISERLKQFVYGANSC